MSRILSLGMPQKMASNAGSALPIEAQRAVNAIRQQPTDVYAAYDPELDYRWGNYSKSKPGIGYFDYFFTGQDVKIYIEGAERDGCSLPILEFGFQISQQKTPIYGFWSYEHDAVMRGTRIVNGAFTIATRYPNLMMELLSEAASTRATKHEGQLYHIHGLDKDEANIEKYWSRNISDSLPEGNPAVVETKNLWLVHPPFNFVIVYGVQTVSLGAKPEMRRDAVLQAYQGEPVAWQNTSERLVPADADKGTDRIIVNNVELMSLQVQFSPDGQPCAETYEFIARDLWYPRR